jgi:hypothetical protein
MTINGRNAGYESRQACKVATPPVNELRDDYRRNESPAFAVEHSFSHFLVAGVFVPFKFFRALHGGRGLADEPRNILRSVAH